MNTKLSDTQKKVLAKMEPGKWYSSYSLGCSLATMGALHDKKYVERSKSQPGDFSFPRTSIKWRLLTD